MASARSGVFLVSSTERTCLRLVKLLQLEREAGRLPRLTRDAEAPCLHTGREERLTGAWKPGKLALEDQERERSLERGCRHFSCLKSVARCLAALRSVAPFEDPRASASLAFGRLGDATTAAAARSLARSLCNLRARSQVASSLLRLRCDRRSPLLLQAARVSRDASLA